MSISKLEDVTLNHFRILKAVDQYQSFSKAAQELGYSQGLISKKVKQLETYFGVRLLNRSPGLISLTNKGKKLIEHTQSILTKVEGLHQEFQAVFDEGDKEITLGTTNLLSEAWLNYYLNRFQLCFPGRSIQVRTVSNSVFFSEVDVPIDLLVNSKSAYREKHHCNRLQTYDMLLIGIDVEHEVKPPGLVSIEDIDFQNLVLLREVYENLMKEQRLSHDVLDKASVLDDYPTLVKTVLSEMKQTILPAFCKAQFEGQSKVWTSILQDISEYGIYIHVPAFSELLVLAEGLVRSFRLEQNTLDSVHSLDIFIKEASGREKNFVRVGVQRDSLGQILAGCGVKYVSEILQTLPFEPSKFRDLEIDEPLYLEIKFFSSGAQINRQMNCGEIDIGILDDFSLLNNGSLFFDGLSFGSRLIGIASYNVLGQDISIVIPKKSAIQSIQDLRHKRISVLFGSNAHRFLITLLEAYKFDVNRDCLLINEDPRTASTSLLSGNVDAHFCCSTFASILEEYHSAQRLYADQSDYFNARIPSICGIVARSRFIKETPKSIVSFLHNLLLANHWFLSNAKNAAGILNQLASVSTSQILKFYDPAFGTRIDPTLKPQWSWLLKTLNRRLEGHYGISKFDVDFWIDDYCLRLVYNLLDLDYHFHQVSLSSELSNSYFIDEKFSRYMQVLYPKAVL
jgi:DNA-binding transcriptional LysR family regulator/ABC-type nitrate/sulfonate/bicarbonate transport system substrate-binding protein